METAPVIHIYSNTMGHLRALIVLRQNVRELLRVRRESQADLALALGFKHRASISKWLNDERQGFQIARLDKLAGFFGLEPFQLFQPGITRLTERRGGQDRRFGQERRIGHQRRRAADIEARLSAVRPSTEPRQQTLGAHRTVAAARKGRRTVGGSDAEKA